VAIADLKHLAAATGEFSMREIFIVREQVDENRSMPSRGVPAPNRLPSATACSRLSPVAN
jgi:hypothetical protein